MNKEMVAMGSKRHIILIGIPSSGKSTLGRRAAEETGRDFIDTDDEIKGLVDDWRDLYLARMQNVILNIQVETVENLAKLLKPAVIAAGPELPLLPNAELLRQNGLVIHIRRDPENIIPGLTPRIFMSVDNGEPVSLAQETVRLYYEEIDAYDALADVILENNGDEDSALEELLEIIHEHGSSLWMDAVLR
jgi:shikimate dehydrogenase